VLFIGGSLRCKTKDKTMKINMGAIDRAARILAAFIIIALYFTDTVSGTAAILLLILSAIFILTGIIGFCPLYLAFRVSSKKT
jgi:hypothetical protein